MGFLLEPLESACPVTPLHVVCCEGFLFAHFHHQGAELEHRNGSQGLWHEKSVETRPVNSPLRPTVWKLQQFFYKIDEIGHEDFGAPTPKPHAARLCISGL